MNTKILLFLATLLLPMVLPAQSKTTIDLMVGVEYNWLEDYVRFNPNIGRPSGEYNPRLGLNINHRVAPQLWLKSGIRLAMIGEKWPKTALRWGNQHDGEGGFNPDYTDPDLPSESQFFNTYWYLEIPVAGRWEFSTGGRVTPFVELGVSPHIYLTTQSRFVSNLYSNSDFHYDEQKSFNHLSVAGTLSVGTNISLADHWMVFVQPIFRYHFSRLYSLPTSPRMLIGGAEFGVRRSI